MGSASMAIEHEGPVVPTSGFYVDTMQFALYLIARGG